MRERLADETHLFVAAAGSAGVITAQRMTETGWAERIVDLRPEDGELVARCQSDGSVALHALDLRFAPIAIPATLVGHDAELTSIELGLAAPVALRPTWNGDDDAQLAADLDLALSWVVTVDGTGIPLGAPDLPPLPVTVQLTGHDLGIVAEIRLRTVGELWSWAGLVKLSDLQMVVRAHAAVR